MKLAVALYLPLTGTVYNPVEVLYALWVSNTFVGKITVDPAGGKVTPEALVDQAFLEP